jgi:Flp pilus assembly pilin Flp
MTNKLALLWTEDDGVLAFEWTLLLTLLTLGIVAGVAASRDAIIDEFGDVAQAMLALDHSMTIDFPLQVIVHDGSDISSASDSSFTDALLYTDCLRSDTLPGQSPQFVEDTDS